MVHETDYWLFRWIDEYGITSRRELHRVLKNPASVEKASTLASEAAEEVRHEVRTASILGGSGMDLARLVCGNTDCRVQLLERVLSKVWFYFDSIILADDIGDAIRAAALDEDDLQEQLARAASVCLAIRNLGAERLVGFRSKPPIDVSTMPKLERATTRLIAELRRGAEIRELDRNYDTDEILFGFRHPALPVVEKCILHVPFPDMTPDEDLSYALASVISQTHVDMLASDLRAARSYELPVVTSVELHRRIMRRLGRQLSNADVAFEMQLPILDGIPIAELLRFRESEYDHFVLFRKRLQELIATEIETTATEQDASKVARRVVRDGIEPELAKLRIRLKAASSLLRRTARFGVGLGALVAGYGAFRGLLPLATAGVAGSVTTGAAAQQKFAERVADVRLDSMYFLWRLSDHSHGSA